MLTAALASPVTPHDRDTRLVPVTLIESSALPVGHDRPGSLWGAAGADALAVVPPGWAGDEIELLALPAAETTVMPPADTVLATKADSRRPPR